MTNATPAATSSDTDADITLRDVLNILYSEVETLADDAYLLASYIIDKPPVAYKDMSEDDFDDVVHEAVMRILKNCNTDD